MALGHRFVLLQRISRKDLLQAIQLPGEDVFCEESSIFDLKNKGLLLAKIKNSLVIYSFFFFHEALQLALLTRADTARTKVTVKR